MDRERWRDFNLVWQAHREADAKLADRWHATADAFSQMMINTAFVLNAGGIVAVPALHQFLNGQATALPWEKRAAFWFFGGVIAAALSGIAAIWNFRMVAEQAEALSTITLKEIEEKWCAEKEFTPSEELELLKSKPLIGSKSIPCTFIVGWVFGVVSYVAFLGGGLTIAWKAGAVPEAAMPAFQPSGQTFADPPKPQKPITPKP